MRHEKQTQKRGKSKQNFTINYEKIFTAHKTDRELIHN